MKKIIRLLILVLTINILSIMNVNAEEYKGTIIRGEVIPNIYYYKHRSDTSEITYPTHHFHESAYVYRESLTNNIVYCIESWSQITGNQPNDYTIYDKNQPSTNLTDEEIKEINLIAYYGYGYKDETYNHTSIEWYAYTQMLIWQLQAPNYEHYFVDSETSTTPLNKYNRFMTEIMVLVNNHKLVPKIDKNFELNAFSEQTFRDSRNRLSDYKVVNANSDIEVSINDDKLTINSLGKSGNFNIKLVREDKVSKKPMKLYLSNNYQNIIEPGKLQDEVIDINIEVKDIKLKFMLCAFVFESMYYDDGSQVKYNYYPLSDLTIDLIVREDIYDKKGGLLYKKGDLYKEFNLSGNYDEIIMVPGKYTIEQKTKIPGYYPFIKNLEIQDNRTLQGYIEKSSAILSLNKENEKIDEFNNLQYIPGENVLFGLYAGEDLYNAVGGLFASKDTLLNVYKTDEFGNINKENPYIVEGKYYFKELSTLGGYEINDTKYEVEFIYEDEYKPVYELNPIKVLNILKRGDLIIFKTDTKTNYALEGVEYELYNENNNLIYRLVTNELGKAEVTLTYGKYYLKESKTLDNYYIDNKTYLIEINDTEYIIYLQNEKINNHTTDKTPVEEEENKNDEEEKLDEEQKEPEEQEEKPSDEKEKEEPIIGEMKPVEPNNEDEEYENIVENQGDSDDLIVSVPSTNAFNNFILINILSLIFIITCLNIKLFRY